LPHVCPVCESREIMVLIANRDRVTAVCKACFIRFEVVPYKLPSDETERRP